MAAIGFWQGIRLIWRDSVAFVRARPILVLLVFALQLAIAFAAPLLGPLAGSDSTKALYGELHGILQIGDGVLKIGLAVQAVRYVLLTDAPQTAPFFGKPFWRYLGICIVLLGAGLACVLLGGGGFGILLHVLNINPPAMTQVLLLVPFVVLALFVALRLNLVFGRAALGLSARWRDAWHDSRGHVWWMAGWYFLAPLPLNALAVLYWRGILHLAPQAIAPSAWTTPVQTLFTTLAFVLNSACSAWIYRRFADRLQQTS
jgi:hypothetical protein